MKFLRHILPIALLCSPPVSNAEDAIRDDSAPADSTSAFLDLVRKHAGPPTTSTRPALSGDTPQTLQSAFRAAARIRSDRDAAARSFESIADRLADLGLYPDALIALERIPNSRRLTAAADLMLRLTRSDEPGSDDPLVGEIKAGIIDAHPFALSFREDAELQTRLCQLAARRADWTSVESILSALEGLPTKEYFARAQCVIALEKARRTDKMPALGRLVDPDTAAALSIRSVVPDYRLHEGAAQFEIAMIALSRSENEAQRSRATEACERAIVTAAGSRLFIGDLLVSAAARLNAADAHTAAKNLFRSYFTQISQLSNAITTKPELLTQIASLYGEWGDESGRAELLAAASKLATTHGAPARAHSLAVVGAARAKIGDAEGALAAWRECLEVIHRSLTGDASYRALSFLALQTSLSEQPLPAAFTARVDALLP